MLSPALVQELAHTLRQEFAISPGAEITLECAPGQLDDAALEAMLAFGVNRISFGVQSLVDREAAATGRSHTRAVVLRDLERVRAAGLRNLSIDLIAGLPHQTRGQLAGVARGAGCDRGRARQHLHAGDRRGFPPGPGVAGRRLALSRAGCAQRRADRRSLRERHCSLEAHGLRQYEISNFARGESRAHGTT